MPRPGGREAVLVVRRERHAVHVLTERLACAKTEGRVSEKGGTSLAEGGNETPEPKEGVSKSSRLSHPRYTAKRSSMRRLGAVEEHASGAPVPDREEVVGLGGDRRELGPAPREAHARESLHAAACKVPQKSVWERARSKERELPPSARATKHSLNAIRKQITIP